MWSKIPMTVPSNRERSAAQPCAYTHINFHKLLLFIFSIPSFIIWSSSAPKLGTFLWPLACDFWLYEQTQHCAGVCNDLCQTSHQGPVRRVCLRLRPRDQTAVFTMEEPTVSKTGKECNHEHIVGFLWVVHTYLLTYDSHCSHLLRARYCAAGTVAGIFKSTSYRWKIYVDMNEVHTDPFCIDCLLCFCSPAHCWNQYWGLWMALWEVYILLAVCLVSLLCKAPWSHRAQSCSSLGCEAPRLQPWTESPPRTHKACSQKKKKL